MSARPDPGSTRRSFSYAVDRADRGDPRLSPPAPVRRGRRNGISRCVESRRRAHRDARIDATRGAVPACTKEPSGPLRSRDRVRPGPRPTQRDPRPLQGSRDTYGARKDPRVLSGHRRHRIVDAGPASRSPGTAATRKNDRVAGFPTLSKRPLSDAAVLEDRVPIDFEGLYSIRVCTSSDSMRLRGTGARLTHA